jgi:quercetin dioxygenase-like cupin family protein
MYAKQADIPQGVRLGQHLHKYDHYSLLLKGAVRVSCDGVIATYTAPAVIFIRKEVAHEVTALTDAQWWCLHETDERDLAKIDESLIA